MGMYTELVLGCKLREETPQEVIDAIAFMVRPKSMFEVAPANLPGGEDTRIVWMFNSGGSYYFGAHSGEVKFSFDEIANSWRLTARFNIKNYSNEIELFLNWLHPYVEQGSGNRDWYAAVTYEEAEQPTIYYLKDTDGSESPEPLHV